MEELEQKISQQGDRIAGQQTEMKVNEQTLAFQRENIREWREKKAETEELQRKADTTVCHLHGASFKVPFHGVVRNF